MNVALTTSILSRICVPDASARGVPRLRPTRRAAQFRLAALAALRARQHRCSDRRAIDRRVGDDHDVDRLPFSVYDFFAYLTSGFLLLAAIDFGFFDAEHLKKDPNITPALLAILGAYIVGHLIANVSAYLLERLLVGKALGRPVTILFASTQPKWRRRLFPGYFSSLDPATQRRVLAAAQTAGVDEPGQGLFELCYPAAQVEPVKQARLSTFLNLYGFCRNISAAALLAALSLVLARLIAEAPAGALHWAAAAGVVAVGMFYRYLKFFRHFSIEVFSGFGTDQRVQ